MDFSEVSGLEPTRNYVFCLNILEVEHQQGKCINPNQFWAIMFQQNQPQQMQQQQQPGFDQQMMQPSAPPMEAQWLPPPPEIPFGCAPGMEFL